MLSFLRHEPCTADRTDLACHQPKRSIFDACSTSATLPKFFAHESSSDCLATINNDGVLFKSKHAICEIAVITNKMSCETLRSRLEK